MPANPFEKPVESLLKPPILLAHDNRAASQICVVWGYLRQMAWNTKLFQQALWFVKMKIYPAKSALDFESREALILELVDEAAARRWLLVKAQVSMAVVCCWG